MRCEGLRHNHGGGQTVKFRWFPNKVPAALGIVVQCWGFLEFAFSEAVGKAATAGAGIGTATIDALATALHRHGFGGNVSIEFGHNRRASLCEIADCVGFLKGYSGCAVGKSLSAISFETMLSPSKTNFPRMLRPPSTRGSQWRSSSHIRS